MYKTILLGTALAVAAAPLLGNAQEGTSQDPVDPGKRCEALYRASTHDKTRLPDALECKGLQAVIEVLSSDVVEQVSFQSEMGLQSYCGTLQITRNTLGGDPSPHARMELNQLGVKYDAERQKQADIFTGQETKIKTVLQRLEQEVPYIVGVTEYQRAKEEVFRKFTVARDRIRAADCVLMPLPLLPPEPIHTPQRTRL